MERKLWGVVCVSRCIYQVSRNYLLGLHWKRAQFVTWLLNTPKNPRWSAKDMTVTVGPWRLNKQTRKWWNREVLPELIDYLRLNISTWLWPSRDFDLNKWLDWLVQVVSNLRVRWMEFGCWMRKKVKRVIKGTKS